MIQIGQGDSSVVLEVTSSTGGSRSQSFLLHNDDTVVVSLFARKVASGTLSVQLDAVTPTSRTTLITFDPLSAPASEVSLRQSASVSTTLEVMATFTGACDFVVNARGVTGGRPKVDVVSGGVQAKGAGRAQARKVVVGTAVQELVSSALFDRIGLMIRNHNTTGYLYIGFTEEEVEEGGFPIYPTEALGIDLDEGVTVYAAASVAGLDARIMESGS